jgi:hypothetical protein
VGRELEAGELVAVDLVGDRAGGIVAPLLGFRLDPAEWRRATERALSAEGLRELAEVVKPGAAVAAVLVEHVLARALEEAVSRTGGTPLASEFVDAGRLADLSPRLRAAISVRPPG